MNNYCLMAGQMMSLVTHNANRCVSFMKIVGFECLELYDWMIFWPEQRACSHDCTSSWMSMQDVPTQVGWVEPSWNETWHCVEPRMVHRATLRAPRPAWDASTKIPHSTIPSKMWFTELYIFGWKSSLSKRLSSIRRQWESGATVSSSGHEKVKRGLDKCALCSLGQGSERFTVVSAAGMSTQ